MTILYGVHVIIIVSKYNGGFAGAQHSHGTTIHKMQEVEEEATVLKQQ